jgi:hypothetical protein
MERMWAFGGFDGFRQKQGCIQIYPDSAPEGKDLHAACLTLYCLDSWCCYNSAQMGSDYGRKGDGVASLCVGSMRDQAFMRD